MTFHKKSQNKTNSAPIQNGDVLPIVTDVGVSIRDFYVDSKYDYATEACLSYRKPQKRPGLHSVDKRTAGRHRLLLDWSVEPRCLVVVVVVFGWWKTHWLVVDVVDVVAGIDGLYVFVCAPFCPLAFLWAVRLALFQKALRHFEWWCAN